MKHERADKESRFSCLSKESKEKFLVPHLTAATQNVAGGTRNFLLAQVSSVFVYAAVMLFFEHTESERAKQKRHSLVFPFLFAFCRLECTYVGSRI
jgi:hypothetical protein